MHRILHVLAFAILVLLGAAPIAGASMTTDVSALDPPPVPPAYQGLRLDRVWSFDGIAWLAGDTPKTFGRPTNFANAPLPDNIALAEGTGNPAAGAELASLAASKGTYINRSTGTAPITIVPADQPLTPVKCVQANGIACVSYMRRMMAGTANDDVTYLGGGLPIPDDYIPASAADHDAHGIFWQPDYVSKYSTAHIGRYYEAWRLRRNPAFDPSLPVSPTNPKWTGGAGGRRTAMNLSHGHFAQWVASGYQYAQPGHPDSTYDAGIWGGTATSLFLAEGMISREDCKLERIGHVVELLVPQAKPTQVWPAQRHDGYTSTSNLIEGMRLRFPPGMARPAFNNRLASLVFDAAQKYGFVISDLAPSVGIRAEATPGYGYGPECGALMDGVAGYEALDQMPWAHLQVLAVGSDTVPNPTT